MRTFHRLLKAAVCLAAFCSSASASYYFVHFSGRTGPFTPIFEKFDLTSLPNHTVYYFVSASGPAKMADGDSFPAILSELQLAAQTWNGIGTSSLQFAFGGLFAPNASQTTPHVEVTFDEVPPGLLALGGPTSLADPVTPQGGSTFVPITRSLVVFPNDLSEQPSSSSGFFLTAVHEFGHTLGLQHTLTSSVMSTDVTRASTKASPLGADDIAGISVLYPSPSFSTQYGSISGQVSMSGNGVALASVVALTGNGQALSALTNPDGTYQINGLAAGNYYMYVHALPPSVQSDLGPSEVVLPVDANGNSFPAGAPFSTQFYPGGTVAVAAGANSTGVNFSVTPHAAPGLYGVMTYSFPGQVAVKPAYMDLGQQTPPLLVAWGTGLIANQQPVAGLNVSVLGEALSVAPGGVLPYSADADFLQVSFMFTPFSGSGPRHLVFSTPNDVYVLPSAMVLVHELPPAITSVTGGTDANGNRVVTINGSNLSGATRILFDGVPATILSADATKGILVVAPPPAPANYQADIVALNPDGQPSLFLGPPASYTYNWVPAGTPALTLSSASQPAGTEAMVEITASNMTLAGGQTSVGFGSSDIVVRGIWVVSPTLVRANVLVAPGAQASDTLVSVFSGLETASLAAGFHIHTSSSPVAGIGSGVVNADPTQSTVFPGSTAILPVYNLPASATADIGDLEAERRECPGDGSQCEQSHFSDPGQFCSRTGDCSVAGRKRCDPVCLHSDSAGAAGYSRRAG